MAAGLAAGKRIPLAAHKAGAASVGVFAAGQEGGDVSRGLLDAEGDAFLGEKTRAFGPRQFAGFAAHAELPEKEGPRQRGGALEPQRLGPAHARGAAAHQHEAHFVESAATGPTDHLQEIVRRDLALEMIEAIAAGGDQHRTQRKIDAGAETERGDDGAQLPGFGEWFDHARPLGVAEAAVMVGHPRPQQLREVGTAELFLLGGERERFGQRQLAGKLPREPFGIRPVRREDQHRPEILAQGSRDAPRPKTVNAARQAVNQLIDLHLLQFHRALAVLDDRRVAAEPLQPGRYVVGIGHGAGEQEQLHLARGKPQHALVVVAAVRIRDPMIFVDDEQFEGRESGLRAGLGGNLAARWRPGPVRASGIHCPGHHEALHRLEGRHHDRRLRVDAEIAGHDAHVPVAGAPFGELVVGQRARGHREERAPRKARLLGPTFENVGLAGARRRVDDHVLARAQRGQCQRLPPVG